MATLYHLPRKATVKNDGRRLSRRTKCGVIILSDRRSQQATPVDPKRQAYDLYMQGSAIDETDPEQGQASYKQALELDPTLAIALTNLGNIRFRMHDPDGAETYYKQALALQPDQPEALYNLGYILLERGGSGNVRDSLSYFRRALAADPAFADAHFNLAMALEQTDNPLASRAAQRHWKTYIKLEPAGTWAEIARRHLA